MKISLKIFLHFLRKEKCLKAYITACKKDKNSSPMLEYMHDMGIIDMYNKCDEDSVVQSFDWNKFAFINNIYYDWHTISKKWRTFVRHE